MRGLRRRMKLYRYKRLEYIEFTAAKNIPLGISTSPNLHIRVKYFINSSQARAILGTTSQYLKIDYPVELFIGGWGGYGYNNRSTQITWLGHFNPVKEVNIKSLSQTTSPTVDDNRIDVEIGYPLTKPLYIGNNTKNVRLYYVKAVSEDVSIEWIPVENLKGRIGLLETKSGKFVDCSSVAIAGTKE